MKYQRTRKAVLQTIVLQLRDEKSTISGKVFRDWAKEQIEKDYPLFHWALNKKDED